MRGASPPHLIIPHLNNMVKHFKKYAENIVILLLTAVIFMDVDYKNIGTFDAIIIVLSGICAILNVAVMIMRRKD